MDTTIKLPQIALRIIQAQAMIIGVSAWKEAGRVSGLVVDEAHTSVSFNGDAKDILNKLVLRYEQVFGKLSDEVCKEAARDLISELPAEEIPSSLK